MIIPVISIPLRQKKSYEVLSLETPYMVHLPGAQLQSGDGEPDKIRLSSDIATPLTTLSSQKQQIALYTGGRETLHCLLHVIVGQSWRGLFISLHPVNMNTLYFKR